ncbi:amidohydrolase family protein [Rhizobium beringeri]
MTTKLGTSIDQGVGRVPADIVLKGGRFFDLVTGELVLSDIAIGADRIVGTSGNYEGETEIDISGKIVVPGFIDTHLHIESSLVTPHEFDRCVLPYGVTTAICDPHEIANVLGTAGIEFFLESALERRSWTSASSSPPAFRATHLETSGADLPIERLLPYRHHPKVIGLAEFMNFPGVIHKDPVCMAKLDAFQGGHIDGHAPLLSGNDLNGYPRPASAPSTNARLPPKRWKRSARACISSCARVRYPGSRGADAYYHRAAVALSGALHRRSQSARYRRTGPSRSHDPHGDRKRRRALAIYRAASISAGPRLRPQGPRPGRAGLARRSGGSPTA